MKCHKKGHFRAVCLSKKQPMEKQSVNEVSDLENVEIPFLGEIQGPGSQWTAQVNVNGHSTCFKLDTGAAVSVISDKEPWLANQQLVKTQQVLKGPGGTLLSVVGEFKATLEYRNRSLTESVYILRN